MADPSGIESLRRFRERASARFHAVTSRKPVALVLRWLRNIVLSLVLVWCAKTFLEKVTIHYPVRHWLFWVYARIWIWVGFFMVACLSSGHLVVSLLLPEGLSLRARALYSMGAGVLTFFAGTFVAGLFGLLGAPFAVAWPAILGLAGAPHLVRRLRRIEAHKALLRRSVTPRPWWFWPVALFGVVCVVAVYLPILTPQNVAFDSHFYHLGLAQQYAAEGAIRPSPEGWFSAAIPHLASVLYTWALLVPGFPNAERVLLAGHMEFALFLATLAGLPPLVRWLVPGARAGLAWVAVFLFPGILLYDSSLSTAADHIAAFWAPLIYLALAHAWRDLEPRRCAMLALLLGGALLTKYQSVQLAILPIVAIAVRAFLLGMKQAIYRPKPRSFSFLVGPLTAIVVGLVVTSPHWLKNLAWYGDPLYPYLHHHFSPRPWSPDAAATFDRYWDEVQVGAWRPQGTTPTKVKETLWALWKFSFEPNDWPKFHGKVPVFGSMFTLLALTLPFLKGAKRLWGVYLGAALAVLQWYWSMHQDRYLQVVLPWMAAGVAATIVLIWRSGILPRLGLASLIGLQTIWGGDVYFIPGHAMLGGAPIRVVSDLLAQGYKRKYEGRLVVAAEFEKVAAMLPPNARILNHEENRRLGLFRPVVSDFTPWQYGIRYGRMESAAALHDKLNQLGVTHVLFRTKKSRGYDTLAGDLRFFDYVTNYAEAPQRVGGRTLAKLAAAPPPVTPQRVLYGGCNRFYGRGLHAFESLNVPELWPARGQRRIAPEIALSDDMSNLDQLLAEAEFVVTNASCKPAIAAGQLSGFVQAATRGKEQLWVRKHREVDTSPAPGPTKPEKPSTEPGSADKTSPDDDDDDPLMR